METRFSHGFPPQPQRRRGHRKLAELTGDAIQMIAHLRIRVSYVVGNVLMGVEKVCSNYTFWWLLLICR